MIYSGGDDLLITGPWDALLILAGVLQREFSRYTGRNPDLTLSAGYVQVKPRYPIQRLAELVDQAEHAAKDAGRNRICAFGQVMEWTSSQGNSFSDLMVFSKVLVEELQAHNIPRSLIVDLGQVYRQHATPGHARPTNPMWTPRLYYTMARRLKRPAFDRLGSNLIATMRGGNILFPVSVVSLSTRKE